MSAVPHAVSLGPPNATGPPGTGSPAKPSGDGQLR